MKRTKVVASWLLALACLTANAQDKADDTEYVFNPHWYIQAQGGVQYTLGEIGFGDLLSPNVQLGVGYNFNPVVGARLTADFWQSKAGSKIYDTKYKWKWSYVAPAVDATFNLSNLFCGYNPERRWDVGVFAGLGLNVAFNNGDANDVDPAINSAIASRSGSGYSDQALRNLWDGTKCRLLVQAGANVDYRISDVWSVGLEVSANTLNDHYNSKKAGNSDWYFNALIGVKCNLGKTYTKKPKKIEKPCPPPPAPKEEVKEVVKVVEKPVEVAKVEPMRRDVFFTISSGKITVVEMQKVREIAEYMEKYPESKVTVTGYADKGTGNATINRRLSEMRAKVVTDALVNDFGIDSSRISSSAKGDTEQPYKDNVLNRVTICIAE